MQACHNKTRPPQYTLLFGNQNNNTIGYTEQMGTANTAFGVLSIEFNRIINLHSFLLGYDECWSMWCIHRSYHTRTTYVSSCVRVCLCLFWQATFNIAIIFGINWNKQATKQKKNINKISTLEKNLIKW